MPNTSLAEIKNQISAFHEGDEKQLEVVFSESPRLIVEAPAGYGKTMTMISRIAYLYASGRIPNPKRILALTFSVNAALKIKREITEKLPSLLGTQNSSISLGDKVTITNYHGICKIILKKYGYLVADALRKDINLFRAIGSLKNSQGNITPEWNQIANSLSPSEKDHICKVDIDIVHGVLPSPKDIKNYNDIIRSKLLPLEFITHNAVILLVLEVFAQFDEVRKFYQNFYPLIVLDEFQDTNCIAWALLESLISDQTQLVFLGDSLQRIYGFIGALPNIMMIAAEKYSMTKISLSRNYRFRDNLDMLKLDRNIRANAANCFTPTISDEEIANLSAFWGANQLAEAEQIVTKICEISSSKKDKIAILFRSRGKNAEVFESELVGKKIEYFYGMFTEDDAEYVDFHYKCQDLFIRRFGKSKNINSKSLKIFSKSVKEIYTTNGKTVNSLLCLLDALIEKVSVDYGDLDPANKYSLLLDIFENHQLKQAMEYVDSQVILSTVHGAKGLEWDYVFLADIEKFVFPSYFVCSNCANKFYEPNNYRCLLPQPLAADFKETALDELSVFYVGVTRAKKQVFISASAKRIDSYMNEKKSLFSCMVSLIGIKLVRG